MQYEHLGASVSSIFQPFWRHGNYPLFTHELLPHICLSGSPILFNVTLLHSTESFPSHLFPDSDRKTRQVLPRAQDTRARIQVRPPRVCQSPPGRAWTAAWAFVKEQQKLSSEVGRTTAHLTPFSMGGSGCYRQEFPRFSRHRRISQIHHRETVGIQAPWY